MATQRITLLKFAGVAGDEILRSLEKWSLARTIGPDAWGEDEGNWPDEVRRAADAFIDLLKAHAMEPPCLCAIEWLDTWSMFDQFERWLVPPKPQRPNAICANRYQIYAYCLPDRGRLKRRLAKAKQHQFAEYDWLITCLREAVSSFEKVAERATLVLIREVLGGSLDDSELEEPLAKLPTWLE
jgi:hypothetical protein